MLVAVQQLLGGYLTGHEPNRQQVHFPTKSRKESAKRNEKLKFCPLEFHPLHHTPHTRTHRSPFQNKCATCRRCCCEHVGRAEGIIHTKLIQIVREFNTPLSERRGGEVAFAVQLFAINGVPSSLDQESDSSCGNSTSKRTDYNRYLIVDTIHSQTDPLFWVNFHYPNPTQ